MHTPYLISSSKDVSSFSRNFTIDGASGSSSGKFSKSTMRRARRIGTSRCSSCADVMINGAFASFHYRFGRETTTRATKSIR